MFSDKHINDTEHIIFKKKENPRKQYQSQVIVNEDNLQTKTQITTLLKHRITETRIKQGYNNRKSLANAMRINVHIIECVETGNGNTSKSDINKICQFLKIKQS